MNLGDHSGKRTGHPYQNDTKSCADCIRLVKRKVQLCTTVTMVVKF